MILIEFLGHYLPATSPDRKIYQSFLNQFM